MKRVAFPSGVFVLLLAVYFWTLAPGNFWIDSGAFSTCNEILGLPHSPGFPLYTVLGRTAHTVLPTDPATASNVYSALTAAAGGVVLYLILMLMLEPIALSSGIKRLAAISGALFTFLSVPVWQSAVRAEVYSLQLLLSLSVVYLFLKTVRDEDPGRRMRFALMMIFFQGLSFANHSLLAVITLPMIIALPFVAGWRIKDPNLIKSSGVAVVLFALAISFYLYLPIRSNHDPAVNSGQPKTVTAAFNSITRTGEDYMPAGAVPEADYLPRIRRLAGFVFEQTGGLVLLGLITAVFMAIRRRDRIPYLFGALVLFGFAITVWAADFKLDNFDIVAYTSLPLTLLIILAFCGLSKLAEISARKAKIGRAVPVVFILVVFFQFTGNLYACDLSRTTGPDRLADIILGKAPPDAILLLNEDNVVLPLWYHCFALGQRPDVAVISAGALYRPSYRGELRQLFPDLIYPKEFEPYKIDDLNRAVSAFCRLNEKKRPILVQFGVPGVTPAELAPHGFLFRYGRSITEIDSGSGPRILKMLDDLAGNATDLLTIEFVARNAFNYGVYFDHRGQTQYAYSLFQYAIDTDPDNPNYLLRLGVAFMKAGKYKEAVMLLEEAAETGEGCPKADSLLKQIADRKYGQL